MLTGASLATGPLQQRAIVALRSLVTTHEHRAVTGNLKKKKTQERGENAKQTSGRRECKWCQQGAMSADWRLGGLGSEGACGGK